jgi:hypothetical protein
MSLQLRLRELFAENPELKPGQVAKAIGATRTSMGDWLSGKTKYATPVHALSLANFFKVNLTWLTTGEGEKYVKDNEKIGNLSHVKPENVHKNLHDLLVENTNLTSKLASANTQLSSSNEETMSFELLQNMYGVERPSVIHAISLLLSLRNAMDKDKQVADAIKALALGLDNTRYKIVINEVAGDVATQPQSITEKTF